MKQIWYWMIECFKKIFFFLYKLKQEFFSFNTHFKFKSAKMNCPGYKDNVIKAQIGFLVPTLICLSYLATFLTNITNLIVKVSGFWRLIEICFLFTMFDLTL